jgi:hypothetical protein
MNDPSSPHVEHGDNIESQEGTSSGITLSPRAAKVTLGTKEKSVGAQGPGMKDTMSFVSQYPGTIVAAHHIVRGSARSACVRNCKCTPTNFISRSKSIKFAYIQIQFNVTSDVPSISSDCLIAAKCCFLTHAQGVLQSTKTSCGVKIGAEGEKGYGASSSSSWGSKCGRSDVICISRVCFDIESWLQSLQESKSGTITLGSCAL